MMYSDDFDFSESSTELDSGIAMGSWQRYIGKTLEEYTLENVLGKGAFGVVYLARHTNGNLYAIKVPNQQYAVNEEQEIAKRISKQHENIVRIDEFIDGFTPLRTCCVLEFCNNGDLNDFVISKKPDLPVLLDFMVGMAKGVNFLHSRRIFHRDLKPHNVLIQKEGGRLLCKITDFGLSTVMKNSYRIDVCGSLMFMAPELADMFRYSFPADVYSLGLIFYCLIAKTEATDVDGRHIVPLVNYKGDLVTLTYLIRRGKLLLATFLREHFTDIESLGVAIHKMLALEPSDRSELGDVIADIADIKGEYRGKKLVANPEITVTVTSKYLKRFCEEPSTNEGPQQASSGLKEKEDRRSTRRMRRDSFEDDVINGIIPVDRVE